MSIQFLRLRNSPSNPYNLQQNLPNAKLILYTESNHGALYQYPVVFVRDVTAFLASSQFLCPERRLHLQQFVEPSDV